MNEEKEMPPVKNGCGHHCIKINNIGVRFGSEVILEDVSLHMHCGSLTALIGPNGAGKTTLIRALLGEIKHSGSFVFRDLKTNEKLDMKVGYVPQKLGIERELPMTVYDLFASFISNTPVWLHKSKKLYNRIYEQLKIFSAEDCIDRQIGKLSGGQLQRVLLSVAITPMPDLLILDEPVSGIDDNGVREFYRLAGEIKEKYDLAILLVSHDLDMVKKYADKVVLMDRGILCQGTPDEVFADRNFTRIFGGGEA